MYTMTRDETESVIPELCRITKIQRETPDTFTMTLSMPEGATSRRFKPGQFNMLYAFGVGESAISISGDPARTDEWVHTLRAVGSVTRALTTLKPGHVVGVRGPFGSAWPVDELDGRDLVIIAGGIGLAPLRPLIYHALRMRHRLGRVVILYGARTPEEILYAKELQAWRSRFDLRVRVTVDRGNATWRGNVGVVTRLITDTPFDPYATTACVCGPEVMMRYTVQELQKRRVSPQNIFISMERNMKCAVGLCGHCQYGPKFICKDGPVFRFSEVADLFNTREI